MSQLTINLWFDTEAEEAAKFYTAIFPNSSIGTIAHYPDAGQEITGKSAGDVLTVEFNLDGQPFVGLNGGNAGFKFNESISFIVAAETQADVDRYWEALTADGGDPGQCGWLKDKYGVSWQIIPPILDRLLNGDDPEVAKRVMEAMLKMRKIIVADLESAANAG